MRQRRTFFPPLLGLLLFMPLGSSGQEVPLNFQAAEQSTTNPTPSLPPGNYNILNINISTGSRTSASAVISNTFGVSSEATSSPQSQSSAAAVMGIKDMSSFTNSLGADTRFIEIKSLSESSSINLGIATPGLDSRTESAGTTTIVGVSTIGTINLAESSANCDELCKSGSSFTSNSSTAPQDSQTTTSGSARGFLNTSVNVDAQQSNFTTIFYNSF